MKDYQDKEKLVELYNKYNSAYKIAEILNCNEKTIYRWMQKFEITPMDRTQAARKYKCNHNYFEVIDTSEKAYWLGFIMADGCVYKGDSKGSYRLQINLRKDDCYMIKSFNEVIESNYKIKESAVENIPVVTLKINSTKMCADLMNLGVVPRKSLICRMPNISEVFYRDFIRGYFDGDGCITGSGTRWKICIAGGSCKMLEDFQAILISNEMSVAIYGSSFRNNVYSLESTKHETLQKFYDYMYKDAKFYMPRKKEKYDKCISMISPAV